MRTMSLVAVAGLAGLALAHPAAAQMSSASMDMPMVGGAAMYPTKTIVQNASAANNLTTLVAAVKAGGLVDTLQGAGPFTVFAPTNDAFGKLPPGTVDTLLKPENKAMLDQVLTYHVVPGRYTTEQLMAMIDKAHGTAMLKTVEGEPLKLTSSDGHIFVEGTKSGVAEIVTPNVAQSNGMVQVVSSVLLPG